MAEPYNLSFMDNATSISGIATGVNTQSSGWLFGALLLVIYIVIIMAGASKFDLKNLLVADGFVCSIIGGLMLAGGWISPAIAALPVIALAVSVMLKAWGD